MGLDVYLYRYEVPLDVYAERKAAAEKLDEELAERIEREVGFPIDSEGKRDWKAATQEQKDAYFAKVEQLRAENGLDTHGEPAGLCEKVEINSALHPEHMFKIGYFRSSYNEGG